MAVRAEASSSSGQRDWWLRAVLVLQSQRAVFAALKDESQDAVEARQEPVTALVFLAGIAGVLLAPRFGRMMDDHAVDGLLVAVIAVAAGGMYGFFAFWVFGWGLSACVSTLHGSARAHLCRHLLAYSAAPLALSLFLVWPLKLALYGSRVFKSGGPDSGTGGTVLRWIALGFVGWSLALLVVGLRTVEGWSWPRALVPPAALTAVVLLIWAAVGR